MSKFLTAALVAALLLIVGDCIAISFTTTSLGPENSFLEYNCERLVPVDAYACSGEGPLRQQYYSLAEAFREPVGAARQSSLHDVDLDTGYVRGFLKSVPVPQGDEKVHDDIVAALKAWYSVQRDSYFALPYCRVRGGHPFRPWASPIKERISWEALECERVPKIQILISVAQAHTDLYFDALDKLYADSYWIHTTQAVTQGWEIRNDPTQWIFGVPAGARPFTDHEVGPPFTEGAQQ